jgi:carbonic anhydrase/acetyltransferase-like protein (isoleucine patch superfamily)
LQNAASALRVTTLSRRISPPPIVGSGTGAEHSRSPRTSPTHSFICDGVEILDDVFVGHGVVFMNDKYPRATNAEGEPKRVDDWELLRTVVAAGATLGSGALVLGGVSIGECPLVGAGAVVTRDVETRETAVENPARHHGQISLKFSVRPQSCEAP